jgi:predicted nucleotidyltransferase
MNAKTQYIGQFIRETINKVEATAEAILYGSRARGDERPDSDWDILILTDDPVDITKEREFRDVLYDLELETGEAFSLFVYSKTDWYTKQRITPFFKM